MATRTPSTSAADQTGTLTELPVQGARRPKEPLALNHPFRYWLDLGRVRVDADGQSRYQPVKISVRPGVQHVPENGDSTTIDGLQRRNRRVEVPLDFEVLAWGRVQKGYLVRRDIGTDALGKQLWHYHDVWTRYEWLGDRLAPSFDEAGWLDFTERVELLAGKPPMAAVVRAEKARLGRQASSLRRMAHASPGAERAAEAIEERLTTAPTAP